MKTIIAATILLLSTKLSFGQKNFSGTWSDPALEMISGIQYANALPNLITVIQTKDSIKLARTTVGSDVPSNETLPLNGKTVTRVGKTSKRTIKSTATWSSDGKMLTIESTYSYAEKPAEVEFKNSETWSLSGNGTLVITKTSDATVTDDWTIKGVFSKKNASAQSSN